MRDQFLQPIGEYLNWRRRIDENGGVNTGYSENGKQIQDHLLGRCELPLYQFLPVLTFRESGQLSGRQYGIVKIA